jgi:hypothetical protein
MAKRSVADFFAPQSKISKEGRPVFVLAPSAGGTPPKASILRLLSLPVYCLLTLHTHHRQEVLEILKEMGKVHCLEGSWPNKIFDSAKNVEKVRSSCNVESDSRLLTMVLFDTPRMTHVTLFKQPQVLELAEEADAAAGPGATVWLCGTSFGCRVLVKRSFLSPPSFYFGGADDGTLFRRPSSRCGACTLSDHGQVEVLSKHSHRLPASVKPGALLCLGFPLYGEQR